MNETRPLITRLNWYWIFQLTGWTFLPLMSYLMGAGRVPGLMSVMVWGAASGVLITDVWHRMLKRRLRGGGRTGWKLIALAVPALGTIHIFVQYLGYLVFMPTQMDRGFGWVPAAIASWWAVYLVWNIFYMAVISLRRANRAEAESLRLEVAAKDAELRALQAQVNPHFFFNSMNSVRALIYEDPDAAALMIDQLASVMRYALQSGQHDTVPLAAEIEAVQAYLSIEKIRFEERMQVSVEIGVGLEQVRIPPMSLQTLVENAVKYGVETSAVGSEIRIRAQRMENGAVLIDIANKGQLAPLSKSTQIGLTNASKRLALVLGGGAQLELSETSGWVRATLTLPEAE